VTGNDNGIYARNIGTGATLVSASGAVTGTTADGIFATTAGTNLTINTTAAVTGGADGIDAQNDGNGFTLIPEGCWPPSPDARVLLSVALPLERQGQRVALGLSQTRNPDCSPCSGAARRAEYCRIPTANPAKSQNVPDTQDCLVRPISEFDAVK
jgi:hypothetical protein